MHLLVNIVFILMIFLLSCKTGDDQPSYREIREVQKKMPEVNKILVQKDRAKIWAYVERRDWDMTETEAGLWYEVYEKGSGEQAEKGKEISLKYDLYLLDGGLCYSSDSTGVKKFTIGKGGVEAGLELGVLYLQEGDKARFILPPHLAHGMVGDDACIPARSVIIYDLEVLNITK